MRIDSVAYLEISHNSVVNFIEVEDYVSDGFKCVKYDVLKTELIKH